MTAASMNRVFL